MKNTTIELQERESHDRILIKLPNGSEILIKTSPSYDEIEVTHIYGSTGVMYIKPITGNQFAIEVVNNG